MNLSIRMIGIATTIFWIFLIIFAATAIYSATGIRLDFGESQTTVDANNELTISLPITIENTGYYDIRQFNISTIAFDRQGVIVTSGHTSIPVVKAGGQAGAIHNITINLADLLANHRDYLFSDTEFNVNESVGLVFSEVIPFQASTTMTMPWGAPLHNFSLGSPQIGAFNATHARALVPLSFENHATFDLNGDIQLRMYDSDNSPPIAEGSTSVTALQHSSYNGQVELYFPLNQMTNTNLRLEYTLQTPLFTYGPVVIPID